VSDSKKGDDAGSAPTVAAESWPTSSGGDIGSPLARYRLEGVIGAGGMGEVVSARDEQIGRSVAIKRMRAADAPPEAVARFMREAQIQGRLEHPAVVPVHELWRDDKGNPFFVMKQLAGVTLASVIARAELTRQRMLRALVDVCLAVELAHTRGIVHRDLKPANIMLGDFGEVYVLDWGIAHVMGDAPSRSSFADIDTPAGGTVAGTVLGTPGYMSPEQVRGDADLDGRADVYSLGCILFEILAGKPLHPRGQPGLVSALAGADARPSVVASAREVPPELDAICVAATRDRADRIATARELADRIQRYLDGDRDVALRRDLAHDEIVAAREAMGRSDRTGAMRAAARALALDPHAREAAELVARLMLEPPEEAPPEVDAELRALDERALKAQARLASIFMPSYLMFLPLMYASGFRDVRPLGAIAAIVAVIVALSRVVQRRPRMSLVYASVIANAVLIGIVARLATPLLVAPLLLVVSVMVFATHPGFTRPWALYALMTSSVVVPWLGELLGVLPQTMFVVGDGLVLHTAAAQLEGAITMATLLLLALVVPAIALVLSRTLANERRGMQRALQIQAWQLRQLVPS
jgi:serine/threonine-protein kinase